MYVCVCRSLPPSLSSAHLACCMLHRCSLIALTPLMSPTPPRKQYVCVQCAVLLLLSLLCPCPRTTKNSHTRNNATTAQMLAARADIVSEVVTSLTQTAVRGVVRGLINNVLLSTRAAAQRNVHPLLLLVDDVVAATLPALLLEAARQSVNDLVAEFLVGRHFDGTLLAR